jgi:hypothetical protein
MYFEVRIEGKRFVKYQMNLPSQMDTQDVVFMIHVIFSHAAFTEHVQISDPACVINFVKIRPISWF